MSIHKNARLTPIGRERLVMAVLSGQTPEAAARAAGVCPRTARKWVQRFEEQGRAGFRCGSRYLSPLLHAVCRFSSADLSFAATTVSRSGLSVTAATGVQFRVFLDQRRGLRCRASL